MENEELKNKLIEKLEREVNEFKDTLRGLFADEIMDNSYKLTCIIEMKDYLIYNKELSKFELKTLLKNAISLLLTLIIVSSILDFIRKPNIPPEINATAFMIYRGMPSFYPN
mgnify:CR=1 FL=1